MDAAPKVAELMQVLLKWDDVRRDAELAVLERTLNEHMDLIKVPVS